MSILVIKNAQVFAPQPLGVQDLVVAGGKIVAMGAHLELSTQGIEVTTLDAEGAYLIPGLVDPLAHITGGGGEGGFHTRTPEMQLSEATLAGVTTLVAGLGTDATTRTLPDLLAKAHALTHEGLSVYTYTGSYELPARTVTGSVRDDIILIDKCIGVGEVAIADHRGSQPDYRELAKVAAEARVGGMLSGKRGIVFVHVGGAASQLGLISEVADKTDIPISQFYPTHLNRSSALLAQGVALAGQGLMLDVTASTTPELLAAGELSAAQALAEALAQGLDENMISFSSDGNASLPEFNAKGELTGLKVGRIQAMHDSLTEAVKAHNLPLEQVIKAVSSNAARNLGLTTKGHIKVGADADLVLLDPASLAVEHVFAQGEQMVAAGKAIRRGTFE
ncbi:MAG: beta-aspartyl-peptidase [Idiomarina sp.]|nr:beta-aspartyl-peptidase [Idiomarina sp.]